MPRQWNGIPADRGADVWERVALATQDTKSLFLSFRTHAETRALNGAVLAGASIGLIVSVAYVLTAQMRLSADEARISRLTDAAVAGYAAAPATPAPASLPTALNTAPGPLQLAPADRPAGVSRRGSSIASPRPSTTKRGAKRPKVRPRWPRWS